MSAHAAFLAHPAGKILMKSSFLPDEDRLVLGLRGATRSSGELTGPSGSERLEPRVMELLWLLASRAGEVVPREEILRGVWPGVVVGDDTLARAVSRLRKALGDDPRTPRYIETLHKRGYRYIGPVGAEGAAPPRTPWRRAFSSTAASACLVAITLAAGSLALTSSSSARATSRISVERADDYYFQYSRPDNEAAIELYERIIAADPRYAPAHAGLANALVQRAVRWPSGLAPGPTFSNLADALRGGYTRTAGGRWILTRAHESARRAVALAPHDPAPHKALGFVASAQEDFAAALESYRRAVALDRDAWGPMINIADILSISGHEAEALGWLERAYAAMTRRYDDETARIRPWYAEMAVVIGDRHRDRGDLDAAQSWYRRVLEYAPFHRGATARLSDLLLVSGDAAGAARLCHALERRIGTTCR
jgi:transcriptional activator of cad operon